MTNRARVRAGRAPRREPPGVLSLGTVLLAACATMALGFVLLKSPCVLSGSAAQICYSDVDGLYSTQGMDVDRNPYLEPCPSGGRLCDEYPVLTMYTMRGVAAITSTSFAYLYVTAALLGVAMLAVIAGLWRIDARRALLVACSPPVLLYTFLNWDALAVALAVGGLLAYGRERDGLAGALLGLGAAAKLFPFVMLAVLCAHRWSSRGRRASLTLGAWGIGSFVAVTLPFAVLAPEGWATFFRFNSERPPDIDSLWFTACNLATRDLTCPWPTGLVNASSAALFVLLMLLGSRRLRTEASRAIPWRAVALSIAAFLIVGKVYSPQFSLWVVGPLAFASTGHGPFLTFIGIDTVEFVARSFWIAGYNEAVFRGEQPGGKGTLLAALQVAVVARAVVLAWIVSRPAQGHVDEYGA